MKDALTVRLSVCLCKLLLFVNSFISSSHFVIRSVLNHECKLILTNSMERVLLQKLIVTQLVKKFTALYGFQRFALVFTRDRHWSLS